MIDYENDILGILQCAPEGLTIRKIVRHVYNAHNTFFETVDFEEVKYEVSNILLRKSKTPGSIIEHTGDRGKYRLNPNSAEARQLKIDFTQESIYNDVINENESPNKYESKMLDMFEGMY